MSVKQPAHSLRIGRAHRYATCWRLDRSDGLVLRFTDHDAKLTIDVIDSTLDGTYTPVGGFDNTASEKQSGLKDDNLDFRGILESSAITHDDLRAGLYHNAEITEFVVDWRYPWAGVFRRLRYFIREVTFNGEQWTAKVVGLSAKLRQPVGRVFSRTCRYELGDSDTCKVDLTSSQFTFTGTVSTIENQRTKITASALAGNHSDDFFTDGVLTWTSGNNDTLQSDVSNYVDSNGEVEFFLATPFDIQVGDTFSIHAGCGHTLSDCINKFNNVENHGGFPTIPGNDNYFRTPNAR